MSMTKYECHIDSFQGRFDLSYTDYPTLKALSAGHDAIELLQELVHGACDVGDVRIYKLLEEWN